MPVVLTESEYQTQVYYDLAGTLPGPPAGPAQDAVTTQMMAALQTRLPTMWAMQAGRTTDAYLQYLFLRRAAIILLMGQLRMKVDAMLGRVFRISASQTIRNLQMLLKGTDDEIKIVQMQISGGASPLVGQILQRTPAMPPPGNVPEADPSQPVLPGGLGLPGDPNAPQYGGDPRFGWPGGRSGEGW